MANFKINNIIFMAILALILNINTIQANENIPSTYSTNYEEIYDGLTEPDFNYIFGLDPYQTDDYTKYIYSPYPLFRSGVTLIFKSTTIPPGYYLLTPREKNGQTWVLFKENGKISYVIPVYKQAGIPENFYEENLPHEYLNLMQKANKKTMNFIGTKWGKKNKRTPIPQSYVEFDDKGDFWDMTLYYGNKKYCLLFKKG